MTGVPENQKPKQPGLLGEFWVFLKNEKKWWLIPLIFLLLLLGAVVFLFQGEALAPFLYPFF